MYSQCKKIEHLFCTFEEWKKNKSHARLLREILLEGVEIAPKTC